MSWKLITPPAELPVSIEAARRAARASGTALDAELEDKVRGIADQVEHKTGRALIEQTWRLTLDAFPAKFTLRRPPLLQVDHIKFFDTAGAQQTLDPQDYQVDGEREPGEIVVAPGHVWPPTARQINAVQVQVTAGYGPSEASVPPAIKEYILGMLEQHYYPNPNAQYLVRRLDRYVVYG